MNHHRHDPTDLDDPVALRGLLADAVPEPPHRVDAERVVRLSARRRRRRIGLAGAGAAASAVVVTTGLVNGLVTGLPGDRAADGVASAPSATPSGQFPVDTDWLDDADLSGVSRAQAAEIADRVVTEDEYHAAFQRYRECMRAGGFDLGDGYHLDNGVYSFSIPGEAVDSGVDGACYAREYEYTDGLWQTSPAIADRSPTTQLLRDCLQERGVTPKPSRADIDDQLRQEGMTFGDCMP